MRAISFDKHAKIAQFVVLKKQPLARIDQCIELDSIDFCVENVIKNKSKHLGFGSTGWY